VPNEMNDQRQRSRGGKGRRRDGDPAGDGERRDQAGAPGGTAPGPDQGGEGARRARRRPPRPPGQRQPRRTEEAPERYQPERAGGGKRNARRRGEPQPGTQGEQPAAGGRQAKRGRQQTEGAAPSGPKGRLRVIPLGGVGEIGKNMTVVEHERDLVALDCGAKFPEEEQRGIDLIVPDVTYIVERLANFRGFLITHGHEDHIGGLPYVLPLLKQRAPIPIYGSPLALGFLEERLREHRVEKLADLHPVQPGERVPLQSLTAEFIHVTHSIPDTNSIAIHSPIGTVVDTADFKFDPTPVMGRPTDERRFRRIGDEGVLALLSDTVRVENAGSTPSERVVLDTMQEVFESARGQVIITTFASNISRIYMALLVAKRYNRKVAVAGRSMEQNARVAVNLGYLPPAEAGLLPLDDVLKLPKNQRVLVITGSQGEATAALSRIAAGEHPRLRVAAGDVVLISATPVPGNEETVTRTIDNLFRRGAKVIYSPFNRGVHVSGHAGRDELRKMLELLRPKFAVPIHGEFRHMVLYKDLAIDFGMPPEHILLPEVGGVIEFTPERAMHRGRVPSGSILVDRLGERGAGQIVLRNREHLTEQGVVVVSMVVDRESGKLIAGPDIVAKGLPPELANGALTEAERDLRRSLERRAKGEPEYGYLVQRAKEIVGKALSRRGKTRPMILPVVTEI